LKRQRHLPVKWKLFLFFTLFASIVLVLLWMFQVVFLDSFYKAIKTHEIYECTETIEKNIKNTDIESMINNIASTNGLSILVLDSDGTERYSSEEQADSIIHKMDSSGLYRYYILAKQNGGSYVEKFERKGAQSFKKDSSFKDQNQDQFKRPPTPRIMESIIEVKIVTTKTQGDTVLYLNSVISPIDSTISTLRVQLLWITMIMIVLALILALLVARRIATPIEKINKSAKELSEGNYGVHFAGGFYREIDELSHTLNYAASELSRVEELRRELLANISHDLRTPLTMITGYGEMMRDVPDENTGENIEVIIGEAKRLTTLVNDLLDLSKIQAENALSLQPFNLTQNLEELVGRYTKLAPEYQIVFDNLAGEVTITADEVRILQIAYNLINNAITYTGEDKKVTIKQEIEDDYVKVSIIDSGQGISPEDVKNVWQRYYRAGNHKRAVVGTGLGLSIVRSAIDMHNSINPHMADCGVESQLGVGSNFWFKIKLDS